MRKAILAASAAALAILAGSVTTASGELRGYDVSDFDEVTSIGPNHVVVSAGPSYSVRAEGPQEMLDFMKVVGEDGELKILPKKDHHRDWDWEWPDTEPATFYVTLPELEAVALVGSGNMTVDRASGEEFSAMIAGSGTLDLAAVAVEEARFSIAGSGGLKARGTAQRSHFSIAGSGKVEARGMTSRTTSVSIAGSGDADLSASDDAHISIVGSGKVDVAGGARCTVSHFGGGQARCNGVDVEPHSRWASWGGEGAWDWSDEDWGEWRDWQHWRDQRRRERGNRQD